MQENDVDVVGRLIPNSGKVHQNQEVYNSFGIICTLKATHYKDPPKILNMVSIKNDYKTKRGYRSNQ